MCIYIHIDPKKTSKGQLNSIGKQLVPRNTDIDKLWEPCLLSHRSDKKTTSLLGN